MYLYADRIRVQTYKGWRRIEAKVRPASALFVGQMMNDKSVCQDGRFLTLLDYRDRLEELAAEHDRIYFSRHPYMRTGDEAVMAYVQKHPKIELAPAPSYRMLSSQRIQKVFSLSSSVVQEARYFDKETEYLFRPFVEYGDPNEPHHGASIMQEIVNPRFWSDVLSPLMQTADCPDVRFRNSKDKLRDMLGFYWSYADIDKVEHMRKPAAVQAAPKVQSRKAPKPRRIFKHPDGFTQTEGQMADLRAQIARHKVISFDIFDTLIERVIDAPSDLFELMSEQVREITGQPDLDFPSLRRKARDMALGEANGEEVLLSARYAAIARHLKLSKGVGEQLFELELAFERAICKPRYAGKAAFDAARASQKPILLISDIFFDRPFVETLLADAGYAGWERLYLSSEAGVLKQTGRLFDHVISKEGFTPSEVLHIGDNAKADIEMGASRGLATYHLPDKARIASALSKLPEAYSRISDGSARSLIKGLTARAATQAVVPDRPGLSHGSPEHLGYAVLGPAFWAFAKWILSEARAAQLSDIFFLARDGDIAKRCYDIVTEGDPSAPKPHYILASRRALNVANLHTPEDIARLLETNFSPCQIGRLLFNRFGIRGTDIPATAWPGSGFESPDARADWKTNKRGICAFFAKPEVAGTILKNANAEREALKAQYERDEVTTASAPGFVDIGHSGSLQAAIARLFGLSKSTGLYFCTKSDIDAALPTRSHRAKGFVADRMSHADANHPYQRHILMYELMFQNDQGSFVRFGPKGPEFLDKSGEAARIAFIRQAHEGICRFVRDITELEHRLSLDLAVSGPEASAGMASLFSEPWPRDAQLFQGIGFENKYSSRDIRWIIPEDFAAATSPPLWQEGAALLKPASEQTLQAKHSLGLKLLQSGAFLVRDTRKRQKLLRDPGAFIADSRQPAIRLLKHLT